MCVDHRHPQTLVEMCRNMGICYGFRSVAARVLGFELNIYCFIHDSSNSCDGVCGLYAGDKLCIFLLLIGQHWGCLNNPIFSN